MRIVTNEIKGSCLMLNFRRMLCQNVKELPVVLQDDEDPEAGKKSESLFNKSRLLPQHRKMLLGERPYDEPQTWAHLTEKYHRKMFGRYGFKSNVNPRICFPTAEDIKQREEYERIAYPYTLQEMMGKIKLENQIKYSEIKKREDEIEKKLQKLEQWKAELIAKVAKKEADALAVKEKKERLVEEVRQHFGFKLDPRDERFKELLEKKEKEDKKKEKEAKRKAKEDKMMAKLLEKTSEVSEKNGMETEK